MIRKLQKAWMNLAVTLLVLCGFAVASQAQLVTDWERNARPGAEEGKPAWMGSGTERGIAYGVVGGVERLYIASREQNTIRVVDPTTGADVILDTPFDMAGVSGGGIFGFNTVGITEDGVTIVSALSNDGTFRVYVWETEGGTFDKSAVIPITAGHRVGDKMTVVGSWAAGTVEVWTVASTLTPGVVYKFTTTDQGENWVTESFTLSGDFTAVAGGSAAAPIGIGAGSSFYVNGQGTTLRAHDSSGAYVEGTAIEPTWSSRSGLRYIDTGDSQYLVNYNYRPGTNAGNKTGHAQIYDVTDITAATSFAVTPFLGNPDVDDPLNVINGDVDYRLNNDGTFTIFVLDPINGIGSYSTEAAEPPATARLQVIHNAADPAAANVDVYINGNLELPGFAFRAATPFIDVPAGEELSIAVAPAGSSDVGDAIATFPVTLAADETYVVFANGVLDPLAFEANPGGLDIAFTLIPVAGAREAAEDAGDVDFFVFHGATDAPAVDVLANGGLLVNNAAYGDATAYFSVPPASYLLDITPAGDNETIVARFEADLSGLAGGSAVVAASGFLNPVANQDGPAFGLIAVLADGTVLELPTAEIPDGSISLLAWETQGLSGATADPFNATTVAANMAASALNRGPGLNSASLANAYSSNGWDRADLAGAVEDGNYIELSVQAVPGYQTSLSRIDFNFRRSGSGPNNLQWAYSLDGIDFTMIGSPIEYTGTETNGVPLGPVSLSGIEELQEVKSGTQVSLRLYGWGASTEGGTGAIGRLEGDDLVVTGFVEVDPDFVPPSLYVANLSGINEVPANLSEGTGTVNAEVVNGDLVVTGVFSGLTGDYTMSHIHVGAAGVNGGIVFTLNATVDPDSKGGEYEAASNTFSITGEQIAALTAGTYYVNIHTTEFPAGEIRGQLLVDPNENAPTASSITAPADGADVTLEGLGTLPFTASWTESTDADGHAVAYVWQLSTTSDFSEVALTVSRGGNTSVTFTFAEVDALLDAAGVPDGGTVTLYHRAISTDGSLFTIGDAVSVNVTRGVIREALTIAEALATDIGTIVTVDGIVTRARGRESRIQDETAAMGTFSPDGTAYNVAVGDGSVAQGDLIRITGRRAQFNNVDQIDNISAFEVLSRENDLPEAQLVTLADIRDNGEALKSQLVRVVDITINPAGDTEFSAGTGSGKTYRITDATVTEEAVVDFRVPNEVNTNIVGTPIPTQPFVFEGVLGVFQTTFQLYAVNATDVIAPAEQLSGVYFIPKGENARGFDSLAEAFDAVNETGLSGPVTFLIDDDLDETANVLLLNRSDLTEQNSLLIKPAAGKTPTISVSANNTGENAGAGLVILGTSWVTIDGSNMDNGDSRDLTITSADNGLSGNGLISVYAGSNNVTIKNSILTYTGEATATTGIRTRRNNDDNVGIENFLGMNNQIGTMDVPFGDGYRFWGSEANPNNSVATGNDIYTNHRGITTFWNVDNEFSGNRIWLLNPRVNQGFYAGIYLVLTTGTTTITGNEIYTLAVNRTETRAYAAGIAINATLGVQNIFNNTIAAPNFENTGAATGNAVYGIALNNAAGSSENNIFHNTMRIGSSDETGVHAAFGVEVATSSPQVWNFRNNIMVVEQDAANAYAFHWPMTSAMPNTDFNNLFVSGEAAHVGFRNGTAFKTLADWQGATEREDNSVSVAVEFISGSDLRLAGESIGDNRLAGTPLEAVLTDIDGTARSETSPYMGAFEGNIPLIPSIETIGPFALVFPTDGFSLTLEGDRATEVPIEWEMPESGDAWARMGGTLENDQFAHGGGGTNAMGKYLGMVLGQEAWIRTPKVVNPGVFKFWAATYSAATVLTLSVEISEDGMDWEELTSFNALADNAGSITSTWQEKEVEVNRTGAYYLRWRQHGESIAGAAYIDDASLSILGTDIVAEEDFESWDAFRELKFTWHADLPGNDFSEPLLSIPADMNGAATTLTLTYGAIDDALEGLGIEQGSSVNVIWTVTAEFGETVRFADSPYALTITRNLDVSNEREDLPLVYALSQNYPNPFNPATNIRFTLPEAQDVRLEVYNIAGQRVATLVNGQMSAGEHIVTFDARALASGVYIYRIIAGEFVKSHKMTLIK